MQRKTHHGARRGLGLALVAALAILGLASVSSAQAACFGQKVTIKGTPGADRIKGTNGRDVIYAGGGNDRINGKGGPDRDLRRSRQGSRLGRHRPRRGRWGARERQGLGRQPG